MILATQLHSEAPVQLLAERSCGNSLLRRGFGAETNVVKIQLGGYTRGAPIRGYAIVDDSDQDLALVRWSFTRGYAERSCWNPDRISVKMHRLILERKLCRPLQSDEVSDHANGNRLDNRRSNLRAVTRAQNNQNRCVNKTSRSGLRGVRKMKNKWQASVHHSGVQIFLGYHATAEIAASIAEAKRRELGFLERTKT